MALSFSFCGSNDDALSEHRSVLYTYVCQLCNVLQLFRCLKKYSLTINKTPCRAPWHVAKYPSTWERTGPPFGEPASVPFCAAAQLLRVEQRHPEINQDWKSHDLESFLEPRWGQCGGRAHGVAPAGHLRSFVYRAPFLLARELCGRHQVPHRLPGGSSSALAGSCAAHCSCARLRPCPSIPRSRRGRGSPD